MDNRAPNPRPNVSLSETIPRPCARSMVTVTVTRGAVFGRGHGHKKKKYGVMCSAAACLVRAAAGRGADRSALCCLWIWCPAGWPEKRQTSRPFHSPCPMHACLPAGSPFARQIASQPFQFTRSIHHSLTACRLQTAMHACKCAREGKGRVNSIRRFRVPVQASGRRQTARYPS